MDLRKLLPALAAAIIAAGAWHPAWAQESVRVRGTKVLMLKPAGFVDAGAFSGFQKNDSGASIMVTELPAPYPKASAGFDAGQLAARGMQLISKEPTRVGSLDAVLVNVSQKAYGTTFLKWMLIFGDDAYTAVVTATFPKEHEQALSATMKKAVQSAQLDPSGKAVDPIADLTYTLPPTSTLKFATRVQNMLMFTPDGQVVAKDKFKALFLVAQSFSEIQVTDGAAFAERRLQQTQNIRDLQIKSKSKVSIAGLPGWEVSATAVDTKWNVPIVIHEVVLLGDRTYYLMLGEAAAAEESTYLPVFQTMAQSFKLR